MKSINDPTRDIGNDGNIGNHNNVMPDVFGEALDYFVGDYVRNNTSIQNNVSGTIALSNYKDHFNGLIKNTRWKVLSMNELNGSEIPGSFMSAYGYDINGQLTAANFGHITSTGTLNTPQPVAPVFSEINDFKSSNITYDRNGNIKSLIRNGNSSNLNMDNLSYSYEMVSGVQKSNRLIGISDSNSGHPYTTDINSGTYSYYANGLLQNATQDNLAFEYNSIGKAVKVLQSGSILDEIFYDEKGHRIKKVIYNNSSGGHVISKTINYINDVAGNVIKILEVSGSTTSIETMIYGLGKIGEISSSLGKTVYEIKDHIGNVRATVCWGTSNNLQLINYNDYYPHGNIMPGRSYSAGSNYRYGYQSQEKDEETGFNNFDLRMYDSRIGRWFNVDPMEQYFSAYLAMGNNPVNNIDPTGGLVGPDDQEIERYRGSINSYQNSQNWQNEFYRNYGTPQERAELERLGTLAQFGDVDLGKGNIVKYDEKGNLVRGYNLQKITFTTTALITTSSGTVTYDVSGMNSFKHPDGLVSYSWDWQESTSFIQTGSANEGGSSNLGTVLSAFDFAAGVYSEYGHNHTTYTTTKGIEKNIFKANGQIRSARAAGFARASNLVRGVAFVGSVVSTAYSGYQVYDQIQSGGLQNVNGWNATDFGVGALGVTATTLVTFGLTSNPIGWGIIGTGALIYGGVRLGYGLYDDYIK